MTRTYSQNIYGLVCEKKADNIKIKGVALENKKGQQKSACVDCGSRTLVLLLFVCSNLL